MPKCYKQLLFGTIFDLHVFKKTLFGSPFRPSRQKQRSIRNDPDGPSRDPAFHETIIITVPFGPNVFFEAIFSIKIGSCSVLSAFLCAIC